MRPVIGRCPKDRETKKVFMLIYVKNCKKRSTRKWGYCGELPCEGPQVLFGTPLGAPFCFERRTFVSTKTYFSKHVPPLYPLTLPKPNYLYLHIVINHPRFIRRTNAYEMTGFCTSLIFTVKGISEQTSKAISTIELFFSIK